MKKVILLTLVLGSLSAFAEDGRNDCVLNGREDIQSVKAVADYNNLLKRQMVNANGNEKKLRALLAKYEKFNTALLNSVVEACTATNK